MPGGRPPKVDSQNRNAGKLDRTDIAVDARRDVPALPTGHGLRAEGKRRWERIWSTAVATLWAEEDLDVALRLCRAHQDYMRDGGPVSLMGEIRQLEMALGLSPRARRELRWRLVDESGPVDEDANSDVADLRGRLRVVGETG